MSIVCPFDGSKSGKLQITRTDDNMPKYNANAENKASTKNNKYKKLCDDRGIVFIPFIIYSTGKIHNDGLKLLQKLATHAETIREIPSESLMKYYMKRLNIALIKKVSYTIKMKAVASLSNVLGRRTMSNQNNIRIGNFLALESVSEPNHPMVCPSSSSRPRN